MVGEMVASFDGVEALVVPAELEFVFGESLFCLVVPLHQEGQRPIGAGEPDLDRLLGVFWLDGGSGRVRWGGWLVCFSDTPGFGALLEVR